MIFIARPSKRRFKLEIKQINYKKMLGIDKIEDVDKVAMKILKKLKM